MNGQCLGTNHVSEVRNLGEYVIGWHEYIFKYIVQILVLFSAILAVVRSEEENVTCKQV